MAVLNALRHQRLAHDDPRRKHVEETAVLNALRHQRLAHFLGCMCFPYAIAMCSTPYGIKG